MRDDTISVSGLSLRQSDCVYPAPYATALINITSSSPISSMSICVNGTYDTQVLQNANAMTSHAYLWKGSVPNNLIPVVRGDTYVFMFVATFQDGSTATTTVSTTVS